jgi:hypothetical protein
MIYCCDGWILISVSAVTFSADFARIFGHPQSKLGDHASKVTDCPPGVPQGSLLAPLLFTEYVSPTGRLTVSYDISYFQLADNIQLYVALNSTNRTSVLH